MLPNATECYRMQPNVTECNIVLSDATYQVDRRFSKDARETAPRRSKDTRRNLEAASKNLEELSKDSRSALEQLSKNSRRAFLKRRAAEAFIFWEISEISRTTGSKSGMQKRPLKRTFPEAPPNNLVVSPNKRHHFPKNTRRTRVFSRRNKMLPRSPLEERRCFLEETR